MRLVTFLLVSLFTLMLAPQANASMESVPANQAGSSYASYVEGFKHHKADFLTKGKFLKKGKKKKFGTETDNDGIVAAILAFVLGVLGIHRVFLGSNGIIVLWYILTIGGLFGIIPLVDFFRLLLQGSAHYRDNDDLFAAFKS